MNQDPLMDNLCINIQMLRMKNGLSKNKMARILHIGVKALNQIESGTLPPHIGTKTLVNICIYFKISPNKLFENLSVNKK